MAQDQNPTQSSDGPENRLVALFFRLLIRNPGGYERMRDIIAQVADNPHTLRDYATQAGTFTLEHAETLARELEVVIESSELRRLRSENERLKREIDSVNEGRIVATTALDCLLKLANGVFERPIVGSSPEEVASKMASEIARIRRAASCSTQFARDRDRARDAAEHLRANWPTKARIVLQWDACLSDADEEKLEESTVGAVILDAEPAEAADQLETKAEPEPELECDYQVVEDRTTPSGKTLFRCPTCEHETPAPTKKRCGSCDCCGHQYGTTGWALNCPIELERREAERQAADWKPGSFAVCDRLGFVCRSFEIGRVYFVGGDPDAFGRSGGATFEDTQFGCVTSGYAKVDPLELEDPKTAEHRLFAIGAKLAASIHETSTKTRANQQRLESVSRALAMLVELGGGAK